MIHVLLPYRMLFSAFAKKTNFTAHNSIKTGFVAYNALPLNRGSLESVSAISFFFSGSRYIQHCYV